MTKFLTEYSDKDEAEVMIPHVRMNAPYVPHNGLGDLGIELEIEGRNLPSEGLLAKVIGTETMSSWATHADGSLRGESIEYVLSRPCNISEAAPLVYGLWDAFKAQGTQLNLSNRCSTHVHVNVGGKKVNELTSIIALWTTFEEPLIHWCGEDRYNNHFCVSMKDSPQVITSWDKFLSTGDAMFNDNFKYSSLNILPLRTFGSFEFRTMRASTDPEPIIEWTKLVHGLVDYASERYSNPELLASDLSERSGVDVFTDICHSKGLSEHFRHEVVGDPQTFNRYAVEGFRRAQSIVLGYPWHRWMPEIEKEYIPTPFGEKKEKRGIRLRGAAGGNAADLRWVEDAFAAAEARNRIRVEPIAPAPIPQPQRRTPINPGRPVNPDLPIEFGDGTPAGRITFEPEANRALVRGPSGHSWPHEDRNAYYNLIDGRWIGAEVDNPRFPWIRNVQIDRLAVDDDMEDDDF